MIVSIPEFWKLLVESRLASAEQAQQLQEMFGQVKSANGAASDARALAQWMASNGLLSLYQAKVLLVGRPGPFVFGDYLMYDRLPEKRFKGTFRAVHLQTRERVLLSFHRGPMVQIQPLWANVLQQTALFSQAVHPNLSRVIGVVNLEQYKFTVLEDLEGQSAEARLADGPIPWGEACRIVQQAALGLSRLTELGLVHGDIRPENLWLGADGTAKLLVPPLARDPSVALGPIDFTQPDPSGRLHTLADYAAPELTRPDSSPNVLSDIYALGCTLYQLITGHPPFTDERISVKLGLHAREMPLMPLESLGVPPAMAQVVDKMMAKDPAERYQTAQQVAEALAVVLEQPLVVEGKRAAVATAETARTQDSHILPIEGMSAMSGVIGTIPAEGTQEHNDAAVLSENMELFDSLMVKTARKRGHKHGMPVVTIVLAVLLMAGLIFIVVRLASRDEGATPETESGKSATGAAHETMPEKGEKKRDNSDKSSGPNKEGMNNDPDHLEDLVPPSTTERKAKIKLAKDEQEKEGGGEQPATVKSSGSSAPKDELLLAQAIVDVDQAVWESPTSGEKISLQYVAPGAQSFLVLRPAELLAHPEAEKILAALGPMGDSRRQALEAMSGAPLSEVEQLVVAWVERVGGEAAGIVPMYVFRFAKPADRDKLLAEWNNPEAIAEGAEQLYSTPSGMAYWPVKEEGRVMVVGGEAEIKESARLAGNAPPLRREIQKMLLASDAKRQVTLLIAPSFVFQNGPFFFSGDLASLATPVQRFLGSDCRGAMLSADLTKDDFFLELRVQGALERSPDAVAKQLKQRLNQLSEEVQKYLGALEVQPYGKEILSRFPEMLHMVGEFARAGTQGNQAVVRCYLPAVAAHNLLMGTELALAEGANAATESGGGGSGSKQQESVTQRLQRVTSLVFARDTLERAVQLLADDIGVKAEIIGPDLQLEGITKNQSFGLEEKDEQAGEILRKIMLKANPDGKLVYVIKPRAAGGDEMLFITTQAAAKKRGDKLPPELIAPKQK